MFLVSNRDSAPILDALNDHFPQVSLATKTPDRTIGSWFDLNEGVCRPDGRFPR